MWFLFPGSLNSLSFFCFSIFFKQICEVALMSVGNAESCTKIAEEQKNYFLKMKIKFVGTTENQNSKWTYYLFYAGA